MPDANVVLGFNPSGLVHEFWVSGVKQRQLPPDPANVTYASQRVGQFQCEMTSSGGFTSAAGAISPAEFAAYPAVYTVGTTWLVKDRASGNYIFGGEIRDPVEGDGVVYITADGWGKRSDRVVDRLLFESQNVELWAAGDQDPFLLTPETNKVEGRTAADVSRHIRPDIDGNRLTFEVERFTAFPRHNGKPDSWASVPWVFWAPESDINRIQFDIWKSADDNEYDLELIGKTADDPDLRTGVTVLHTWGLGAGGPDSVDFQIGSNYQLIGLRVRRTGPKLLKSKGRRWKLSHVKVGGIVTTSPFDLSDGLEYLAGRLGVAAPNRDVQPTSTAMLPYDVSRATIGQAIDDLCMLDNYYWLVIATGAGEKRFYAGQFGRRAWTVTDVHQVLKILPAERFNKVRYEYYFGGGYTGSAHVTANPNPFPVGYDQTFQLQIEEPPIKILAEAWAQKVADYLAQERTTGSATLSQVEDPANPGVAVPIGEVRPGDKLTLPNWDNLEVYVDTISFSQDGALGEISFTSGNPLLDRMIARRQRLLNKGIDANKATLMMLDPERPAAPVIQEIAFSQEEARSGLRFYNMIVNWAAVTADILDDPTAVDTYNVRIRPLDGPNGDPITEQNGGGWRKQTIKESVDDEREEDDLLIDTPTKAIFTKLANPRHWYWQAQVQAIDLLGQRGVWSELTTPAIKPAAFQPSPPENVRCEVVPHRVTVEWKAPDDPDDDPDVPDWKPDVKSFQVQISETTNAGDRWLPANIVNTDRLRGERKTFHVKKTRGKTFYGRVRSVDAYGNKSAWVESNAAESEPPAPENLAIQYVITDRDRPNKYSLKASWDEVNFADGDIDRYIVQLQSTHHEDDDFNDAATLMTRRRFVDAKNDDDPGDYAHIIFGQRVRRARIYRFRVRAVTVGNVKGNWSDWFPNVGGSSPLDDTRPPTPLNVRIFDTATDRVVLDWDEPTVTMPTRGTVSGSLGSPTVTGLNTKFDVEVERGSTVRIGGVDYLVKSVASATSLTLATNLGSSPSNAEMFTIEDDPDVQFFQVQIARANKVSGTPNHDWEEVYMRDRTNGSRKSFKVGDLDRAVTFYGRVRSVDAAYNKSRWVYGRLTANSDPNLSGEGVTIGVGGGGKIVATFTKAGRLRVKHYSNRRWQNTTDSRLYFKRARLSIGDKEAGTGAPTGSSVKVNLKRWETDETTKASVFQTGGGGDDDDRLIVNADTYKDSAPADTFNITYLDPGEWLTLRVAQVGSGYPGRDLVCQVWMEP